VKDNIMTAIFETAVALTVKNGSIRIGKASSGGYIPTDDSDMDELIGVIVEQKLPIDQYSLWIVGAEVADYKALGIKSKTYTSKFGKTGISQDGDVSPAAFKKILAVCDMTVELVKRPFPQPKLVARFKNKPKAVTARSENRIGK
jgi:hypothetical protein